MSAGTPDKETTRHYIDKLVVDGNTMLSRSFRLFITQVALSFILISLSAGIASAQGAFTFQGVGLKVSLAVFLTGCALFVGGGTVFSEFYARRAAVVRGVVRRLYKGIGFEDETLDDPNFLGPPLGKLRRATGLYWAITGSLIPAAAQVAAGFKVAELLQYKGLGWTWILFVLLAFGTAWASVIVNARSTFEILHLYLRPIPVGTAPLLWACVGASGWPLLGTLVGVFVTQVLGAP